MNRSFVLGCLLCVLAGCSAEQSEGLDQNSTKDPAVGDGVGDGEVDEPADPDATPPAIKPSQRPRLNPLSHTASLEAAGGQAKSARYQMRFRVAAPLVSAVGSQLALAGSTKGGVQ